MKHKKFTSKYSVNEEIKKWLAENPKVRIVGLKGSPNKAYISYIEREEDSPYDILDKVFREEPERIPDFKQMREAIEDFKKGKLSEFSTLIVLEALLNGTRNLSKVEIEHAKTLLGKKIDF